MTSNIISDVLTDHPELALFLSLGLGYLIGKIGYGSFKLGAVTGCLIAGVIVGQSGVQISNDVKQAFFLLFLFAIGYRTGPQFFRSLNAAALPQILVTFIYCGSALGIVLAAALIFQLDIGTAAGLLAGGTTESATVGVAIDTFRKMGTDAAAQSAFEANVATSFAVCYLVGVIASVIMLSQIAPRLMRRPLAEACAEMESQLSTAGPGQTNANVVRRDVEMRAFVIAKRWVGRTIDEVEKQVPRDQKAYIEQIRRGNDVLTASSDLILEPGDIVAVAGLRGFLVRNADAIGQEVDDAEVMDLAAEIVDVVVTNSEVVDRTLFELSELPESRTVFLRKFSRSGNIIPIYGGLKLERGDVLTIVGTKQHVAQAAEKLGYADRQTSVTDMVFVGMFIFLGGLIGIPALHIGAVEIGLGVAVGTLLGGLAAGWLRSRHRRFGFVPEAALWLFDSLGLSAFIACVGISAGPSFVAGLIASGPLLVLVTLIVVVVPQMIAVLVGSRLFGINEAVLLGTCCGAATSAPSLAAVQDVAKSKIPTLGYGLGYAIGNVLLALWGAILILVLS